MSAKNLDNHNRWRNRQRVLLPTCGKEPIVAIQHNIEKGMYTLEKDIDQLIANPDIDDKTRKRLIKESKLSLKYVARCNASLLKLVTAEIS